MGSTADECCGIASNAPARCGHCTIMPWQRRMCSENLLQGLILDLRCRVCPFMLRALHYALAKTHALQPNWLALRLSYGMNGVLLRVRTDTINGFGIFKSADVGQTQRCGGIQYTLSQGKHACRRAASEAFAMIAQRHQPLT